MDILDRPNLTPSRDHLNRNVITLCENLRERQEQAVLNARHERSRYIFLVVTAVTFDPSRKSRN